MSEPARSQPPRHPSLEPSTPWSVEASREIFEEMARPPADTPERRATFERAAAWRAQIKRLFEDDDESGAAETETHMHYRRTPELSAEGTREVLEEIENGPRDTPERRAMLEHARAMRPHVRRLRETLRKQIPAEKS